MVKIQNDRQSIVQMCPLMFQQRAQYFSRQSLAILEQSRPE